MAKTIWARLYDDNGKPCGVIAAVGETGKFNLGQSICRPDKLISLKGGKTKRIRFDRFDRKTGLAIAFYNANFVEFKPLKAVSKRAKKINEQIEKFTKRARLYFRA